MPSQGPSARKPDSTHASATAPETTMPGATNEARGRSFGKNTPKIGASSTAVATDPNPYQRFTTDDDDSAKATAIPVATTRPTPSPESDAPARRPSLPARSREIEIPALNRYESTVDMTVASIPA